MKETMEWLSCMKCLWGHAQADNESQQKHEKHTEHTGFACYKLTDARTDTTFKKEKKREKSQRSVLLQTGRLCPPSQKKKRDITDLTVCTVTIEGCRMSLGF